MRGPGPSPLIARTTVKQSYVTEKSPLKHWFGPTLEANAVYSLNFSKPKFFTNFTIMEGKFIGGGGGSL